jgi:hypothetical protein
MGATATRATETKREALREKKDKTSRAAETLDRILDEDGDVAKVLRKHFHRSQLGRWRNARRRPEIEGMILVRELTRGEISLEAWARTRG